MTTTAVEIMTSPVATVAPQASVVEIATLLSEKHISAVPVCRPDGTLAGLVSEGDLLRPLRESVRSKQRRCRRSSSITFASIPAPRQTS
jgi:CBS domain-containing protein